MFYVYWFPIPHNNPFWLLLWLCYFWHVEHGALRGVIQQANCRVGISRPENPGPASQLFPPHVIAVGGASGMALWSHCQGFLRDVYLFLCYGKLKNPSCSGWMREPLPPSAGCTFHVRCRGTIPWDAVWVQMKQRARAEGCPLPITGSSELRLLLIVPREQRIETVFELA